MIVVDVSKARLFINCYLMMHLMTWCYLLCMLNLRCDEPLIRACIRHVKQQAGVDLSGATSWLRFCDLHYSRTSQQQQQQQQREELTGGLPTAAAAHAAGSTGSITAAGQPVVSHGKEEVGRKVVCQHCCQHQAAVCLQWQFSAHASVCKQLYAARNCQYLWLVVHSYVIHFCVSMH